MENVSQKLNYDSLKTYSQEFNIISMNIVGREGSNGFLETSISCRSDYDDTFNELYDISNYGLMISINYGYGDMLIMPFLYEMLEEFPELLVYNEEVPERVGSYVFNKSHLEKFLGTDGYTFFNTPPKD